MEVSVEIVDITTLDVDVVVNAANSRLLGGGGVDGAIHRAAGPQLLEACRKLRDGVLVDGLPVGQAVSTPGFELPARWVVHTVGPNRHAGQTDPALLASAFRSSLDEAAVLGARSVAFPAISAGVYGWDMAEVADIAVDTVHNWADEHENACQPVMRVVFAVMNESARQAFQVALSNHYNNRT